MGAVMPKIAWPRDNPPLPTKRKHDEAEPVDTVNTKRFKSTSFYIFETLYENGEGSDIVVCALGKKWNLHKLYLKQCAYFSSMFNGTWKECDYSSINITIPDPFIDSEALDVAFQSLYKDDIEFPTQQITKVLAAATFLQLEGLSENCRALMTKRLQANNVLAFHTAALDYGLPDVVEKCLTWLLQNIMSLDASLMWILADISPELMTKLVSSPDLFVIKLETDVYTMLKRWLFLHLQTSNIPPLQIFEETDKFYENRKKETSLCLLATAECRPYVEPFRAVRWQHVIGDMKSLEIIRSDQVVPNSWLLPIYHAFVQTVLAVDQDLTNLGPDNTDEEFFNRTSFRCGRAFVLKSKYCWRWVGYNYGIDVLFTLANGLLSIKRHATMDSTGTIYPRLNRTVTLRINLVSLDKNGNCKFKQTVGHTQVILLKNQEMVVCTLDRKLTYPILLSVNMLTYIPLPPPELDSSHGVVSSSTQTDILLLDYCSLSNPCRSADNDQYSLSASERDDRNRNLLHNAASANEYSHSTNINSDDQLTTSIFMTNKTSGTSYTNTSLQSPPSTSSGISHLNPLEKLDAKVQDIPTQRTSNCPVSKKLTIDSSSDDDGTDSDSDVTVDCNHETMSSTNNQTSENIL